MGKQSQKRRERMATVQQAREREGLVKKARLWDRCVAKHLLLKEADVIVSVDNIAQDFLQRGENWDGYDEVFSRGIPFQPPFDVFWVECSPWKHESAGALVRHLQLDGEKFADSVSYIVDTLETAQYGEAYSMVVQGGDQGIVATHYLLFDIVSLTDEHDFTDTLGGKHHQREYDEIGGLLLLFDANWTLIEIVAPDYPNETAYDELIYLATLTLLQYLNTQNVVLVDNPPDPTFARQYKEHFNREPVTYKTLAIKSMSKHSDHADPKPYQALMPLHLRRGNFATYTADAPLFGKYTGTFWRPATAVGEAKNGIAVKDYEVKPEKV